MLSGSIELTRRRLMLAGIVLLGFILRAWGLWWGLYDANVSRRPHPDEWPVYWLFRWFDANHNLDPCPHSRSACFFDWGMAYPYVAYGVRFLITPLKALIPTTVFGPQADPAFIWSVIAGRTTSLLFSTATIVVVYKLASDAFNADAGLVAALVAALSALFLQLAHFATPDTMTSFLLSCTLLAAIRAALQPSIRRYGLAGVLLGLSVASEYHMALLAFPVTLAWGLGNPRGKVHFLFVALTCALCAYVASSIYAFVHLSDFIAATEHTLRIRTIDSKLEYGDRWTVFGPAWLYVVRYPLGYGVGFALTIWMLIGTSWSLLRRTRSDWILLSWLALYFALVTLSPAKFMRYSAPLLPVLAVLSGRVVVEILVAARAYARITAGALAVAAIVFSLAYDGAYAALFSAADPRFTAAQWIAARSPVRSRVTFDQLPNGLINLPYYFDEARYRPCFSEFRISTLATSAPYVVTDNYDREEHPRIPQATVNKFEQHLRQSHEYRLVFQVHHVPTFLGATFSIDGSPHDWRYPSHVISVYKRQIAVSPPPYSSCFANLSAAHAALYPKTPGS